MTFGIRRAEEPEGMRLGRNFHRWGVFISMLVCWLTSLSQGQTNEVRYGITKIDAPPGGAAAPKSINSSGEIAGYYYDDSSGHYSGFAWINGAVTPLPPADGSTDSQPAHINDVGQICGSSFGGPFPLRATVWNQGNPTVLPTPNPTEMTIAYQINNSGQIVGDGRIVWATDTYGRGGAVWIDGVLNPLNAGPPTHGQFYYLTAGCINNNGAIAGWGYDPGESSDGGYGLYHAYVLTDGGRINIDTRLWPPFMPIDINDSCEVVGSLYVNSSGQYRALIWRNGVVGDMGTLGGEWAQAEAINNSSMVVGESTTEVGYHHAFLWRINDETGAGEMRDLNDLIPADSGWVLWRAYDINDAGQIVGIGLHEGQWSGFLLSPLQKVEVDWVSVDAHNPLDDNPNWNGGRRYFPDKLAPAETLSRNKILVQVSAGSGAAGRTVYLKAFDVDDPTPDVMPPSGGATAVDRFFDGENEVDANGGAGDDNRADALNTPLSGFFTKTGGPTASETLDANGQAVLEFSVGMQPGNNYRIAAVIGSEADLSLLQVSDSAQLGFVTPDDNPVLALKGGLSPLLTIWRKLHLEIDSMEAAPGSGPQANFERGIIRNIRNNVPQPGQSVLELDMVLRDNEVDHYENGRIEIQGIGTFKVLGNTNAFFRDDVVIEGTPQRRQVRGRSFRIFDDDDRFLSVLGLPSSLPRNQLHSEIIEGIRDKFLPAYIEVVDANQMGLNPRQTIPFRRNAREAGFGLISVFDDAKDIVDESSFWVHTAVFGYQPEIRADRDPNAQDFRLGGTPKTRYTHKSLGYSVLYVETIRDRSIGDTLEIFVNNPANHPVLRKDYNDELLGILAHEVGHSPGTQTEDIDHAEQGLMQEGGGPIDIDFKALTIERFRKTGSWKN